MLALASDQAITWGDVIIVLVVIALLVFIFSWAPWRRR